jgi:photosystem II stability/assembly factor-like uncharacterized protein
MDSKEKIPVWLLLVILLFLCPLVFGQPESIDGRNRQVGNSVEPKWERVFSLTDSRAFRTVYSVPFHLGKTTALNWFWAGDEDGFVWLTVVDPGSNAKFAANDEQGYFALSRIAVEKFEGKSQRTPAQVKAVLFLDQTRGYVLRGSKIYSTDNAGFTWRLIYGAPDRPDKSTATLWSMAITPSKHACVVGMYSLPEEVKDSFVACTEKTLGGGDPEWTLREVDTKNQLFDISFIDDRRGWIVGTDGTVLRTTDAGKSWTVSTISTESLRQVCFRDQTNGWIVGKGGIFRTSDGGDSWEPTSLEFSDQLSEIVLRGIKFTDSRRGWIVGDKGTILSTNDGGDNWHLERAPSPGEGDLNAIFVDDTFCWAVGGVPLVKSSPRKPTRTIWRYRWK